MSVSTATSVVLCTAGYDHKVRDGWLLSVLVLECRSYCVAIVLNVVGLGGRTAFIG